MRVSLECDGVRAGCRDDRRRLLGGRARNDALERPPREEEVWRGAGHDLSQIGKPRTLRVLIGKGSPRHDHARQVRERPQS